MISVFLKNTKLSLLPFVVKDGQKEVTRYGALNNCLSSRFILTEVVHCQSTDLFLINLRRFVGGKGNVKIIRSDNCSNFVGASTELIHALQEMDHINRSNFLEENGSEWMVLKRNPSLSSKMGGV